MAGAKKVSKNARGTGVIPGASAKAPQIAADVLMVKSLNSGKHAYVVNAATGKTVHCATSSEAFDDAVAASVKVGFTAHVRRDLDDLNREFPTHGWDKVIARLQAKEILPA